jgi:5-dehydro-2-deoxygluconokinase
VKRREEHRWDLICLGRVAVDLYGLQEGGRLEDMRSFAKSLGGSSGNLAFGSARLGLKSAMLSRVGDEQMGQFIREELDAVGCDTSLLKTDKERQTGLVLLGIRGDGTFPHIFFRENCADMALAKEDFSAADIAQAKALAITGTHLSAKVPRAACEKALNAARKAGTHTVLDIDYRPVLWGLAPPGDGESRYVASPEVTARLQEVLPHFDLIVGTEEEFHIAGGSTDTLTALRHVRAISDAALVVKRGPMGCVIVPNAIPSALNEGIVCDGLSVPVTNTLGAGDAFLSGFLLGWLQGEKLSRCGELANGCGALVVSRRDCSVAMPSLGELNHFLENAHSIPDPARAPGLIMRHHQAERRGVWADLCILAFDHRSQFEELARITHKGLADIAHFKSLILKGAQEGARRGQPAQWGILLDERYGELGLAQMAGQGQWLGRPIEDPGSRPLEFEEGQDVGTLLERWPRGQVVKCLVRYSIDDEPGLKKLQDARLLALDEACKKTGHEFLLELLPPADLDPDLRDVEMLKAMESLYKLNICPDWWKLPVPRGGETWDELDNLIHWRDPHCRGVLVLGLNAPMDVLNASLATAAAASICKGFAIGRTIFWEPARRHFKHEIDDALCIEEIAANFAELIGTWKKARQAAGH